MSQCVTCDKALTVEIDSEGEEEYNVPESSSGTLVPDSVELQCGCHFHWQCLLDAYEITQCPNCSKEVSSHSSTGSEQLLCNLDNEGGLQESLDILPILKEESYLKAFPEERRCRAFLEFCGEGDVGAILDLINDRDDEDSDEQGNTKSIDVLRYQDPMGSMSTGLHAAITSGHDEVVWLLLLLASTLEPERFPADVVQAAETLKVTRENQTGKVDIRLLEDSNSQTAEGLARELGGKWGTWVNAGWLKPPN
ncbi:MAG: hypothetical protein Q9218_002720 [Villophora microphyllina]